MLVGAKDRHSCCLSVPYFEFVKVCSLKRVLGKGVRILYHRGTHKALIDFNRRESYSRFE